MKNKTKSKKKKFSLLALGFKKKPVVVRKGYVNSDTIRDKWKRLIELYFPSRDI